MFVIEIGWVDEFGFSTQYGFTASFGDFGVWLVVLGLAVVLEHNI